MGLYDFEEGALRTVLRCLDESAAPRMAPGRLLVAGWAALPVVAVVTSRAESVVRHMQNSLQMPRLQPSALRV
ncbi:hypothetical protein SAMN05660359_04457 [Geodermatophilus obscurus]|uniref:Uncharacterized protein n=1 Tax=Geodermatophilus obscurus TaxID=1861 RepID=A0A1I5IAW7_9ACTN|nr:hypothetical protein [Geodermatophilus obscurus]SFO57296.1 hypothetical protein SAMN05660359_04457 [Geodermatophilus obscurus]